MNNPKLTCYGGVGYVTGANFLLTVPSGGGEKRILVDCGLFQGTREAHEKNYDSFPYDPKTIDYLFVTHAHLDHVGRIGRLVANGFVGEIYSTPATKQIAELILDDALRIMEFKERDTLRSTQGKGPATSPTKYEPLYKRRDVNKAFSLWKETPYHTSKEVFSGLSVNFKDAGHILGSAMIEFTIPRQARDENDLKIVFTGDLGNSPTPLLKDTEKMEGANYMVMESTYGDRNHENKDTRDENFERIVRETIERGGTLVIPAFSLERTQVMLYALNELIEHKGLPSVPVFVDSPLAIKITAVYDKISKHYNESVKADMKRGDDIFDFPKLKLTAKRRESEKIEDVVGPKIIIAGSGMSAGGRVVYHEAKYLPDPKNTLLLIGYQAIGTLGRTIQEGAKEITIRVSHDKEELVKVNAHIEELLGYSSHKDMDHLIEFVEDTKDTLKKVFCAMGEPKSSLFLAQRLRDFLDVDAIYPEEGKEYILD